MALYRYTAIDSAGTSASGRLEAESDTAARDSLRTQGLFPTALDRLESAEPGTTAPLMGPGLRDVALFARQLGTLLEAGFTMVDSLGTIQGQTANGRLFTILGDLKDGVRRGESLSQAMERHDSLFPPMYVSMVLAGEKSGRLPDILARVADYLDRRLRLRNKILVSLAYPALMTLTGAGILVFLVTFIAPTLAEVFVEGERQLPMATLVLMETSRLARVWWPAALAGLVLGTFLLRRWLRTESGTRTWDRLSLKVPLLGPLRTTVAMARFARTLGVLLESGVEVLQAFDITGRVLDNHVLADAVEEARAQVSQGADLAGPLRASGLFPRLLVDMVGAGQKSGRLPQMLIKVADDMDEQVETQLALMTSLVEPLLILAMGAAVGFIVLAVVMPIFEMNRMY